MEDTEFLGELSLSGKIRPVRPLQALAMYNGDFVSEEARHFGDRLAAEAGQDENRQIHHAFELAFARPPDEAETTRLGEFVKTFASPKEARAGLGRVLFNSNEFVYVD